MNERDRKIEAPRQTPSAPNSPAPGVRGILYMAEDQLEFRAAVKEDDATWSQLMTVTAAIYVGSVHHGPDFSLQVLARPDPLEPEWTVVVIPRPGSTDDA